ncbi:MAG: hypothetical protein ACKV1O_01095 [Saprospiraceae bacterium]
MNTNKILLAGLIGGAASFLLGWLVWGIALQGFMKDNMGSATNVMRPESEMIWWALIVGNLAGGLLLALIYGRWGSISTFLTGAKAGAVIGLLLGISYDMMWYATSNVMTLNGSLVDILANAVVTGVVGGIVGWFLGRK